MLIAVKKKKIVQSLHNIQGTSVLIIQHMHELRCIFHLSFKEVQDLVP